MFAHAVLGQQVAKVECRKESPLLTEADVRKLIGEPPARIVQWVETCHIAFVPTREVLDRLRSKGATKAVLDALVRDHPVRAAAPAPSATVRAPVTQPIKEANAAVGLRERRPWSRGFRNPAVPK